MGQRPESLKNLPAVKHPYTEFTLEDAIDIAVNNRNLCRQPMPTDLQGVRKVILDIQEAAGFNWITGMAALDVLDVAISGKPEHATWRIPSGGL